MKLFTTYSLSMRFSIVTDTYTPEVNGVARTLRQIANGLVEFGHEVTVVHPGRSKDLVESMPDTVMEHRVMGWPVPVYRSLRMGVPRKSQFLNEWANEAPEVIYIATEGLLGYSALKAARELEIPVVTGYHTRFPQYMRHYAPPLERVAETYLRHLHNQAECTVAPSRDVALELHRTGYHNVAVMGRGVDTQLFHPEKRDSLLRQRWRARPETIVLLLVGRIAHEKNLPVAIDTYLRLKSRYPDSLLVCVGDGPAEADLQAKYGQAVIWAGTKRREELARYYASADVFLFPSLTETYGNVLPEAMASGLITVAYDYAACSELVRCGTNGFSVAREGGAAAFENSVFTALARKHDWPAMRREARKTAESLSWEEVTRKFESILTRAAHDSVKRHGHSSRFTNCESVPS